MVLILVFLTFVFAILIRSLVRHFVNKRVVTPTEVPGVNFLFRLRLEY